MTEGIPPLPEGWVAVEKEALLRLQKEARIDFLTGLYNKGAFECAVKKQMALSGGHGALLLIDLDNFKAVNDRFGHPGGDRVLRAAADAIRGIFGENILSGRIGGDEFTIFFSEGHAQAERLAELLPIRIKALLDSSYTEFVTISVGIACFPKDAAGYEQLFAAADDALYQAKHAGKARSVVYCGTKTE